MLAHYLKTIVRLKKVREGALPLYGIALFFLSYSVCPSKQIFDTCTITSLGHGTSASRTEVHFFLK